MNYREKIRKAIECPQFGYTHYGEFGALKLEQRNLIKRLLDELDSADDCVKKLYLKNIKYKEIIDKAEKILNECKLLMPHEFDWEEQVGNVIDILKEVSDENN